MFDPFPSPLRMWTSAAPSHPLHGSLILSYHQLVNSLDSSLAHVPESFYMASLALYPLFEVMTFLLDIHKALVTLIVTLGLSIAPKVQLRQ